MAMDRITPKDMDEYIAGFPKDVQERLDKIRMTIRTAVPDAIETIKYGIPTFTLYGNMLSFAAYKKHIGLYPAPSGTEEFNKKLSAYIAEKSTVQFLLDKPIPYDLISQIAMFRAKDMLGKAEAKGKKEKMKS